MLSERCGSDRSRAKRTRHVEGGALAGVSKLELAFNLLTKVVAFVRKQTPLSSPLRCVTRFFSFFIFCE